MAAFDNIKSHKFKKVKKYDSSWNVLSGTLIVDGKEVGKIDWLNSKYIGDEYYAHVSGSYTVLTKQLNESYVQPKQVLNFFTEASSEDEEE